MLERKFFKNIAEMINSEKIGNGIDAEIFLKKIKEKYSLFDSRVTVKNVINHFYEGRVADNLKSVFGIKV